MVRVYVAGPLTTGDWGVNVHRAIRAADDLRAAKVGIRPIVPHLSTLDHIAIPRPYEEWMRECLDDVRTSDAVLRLPGTSPGADREVELAERLGIPVFTFASTVIAWARGLALD